MTDPGGWNLFHVEPRGRVRARCDAGPMDTTPDDQDRVQPASSRAEAADRAAQRQEPAGDAIGVDATNPEPEPEATEPAGEPGGEATEPAGEDWAGDDAS